MGTADNSLLLKLQQSLKEIEKLTRQRQYNISMIKSRQTLEYIVNFLGEKSLIVEGDLADSIDQLYEEHIISPETKDHYHRIRMIGNKAVHEGDDSPYDAKDAWTLLSQEVHTFANSFHNRKYRPSPVKTESSSARNAQRRTTPQNGNHKPGAAKKTQANSGRYQNNGHRSARKPVSRNSQRSYSHKKSRRRPYNSGFQPNDLLKPALIFLVIFIIVLIIIKIVPGKNDKKATTPAVTSNEVSTSAEVPSTEAQTPTEETVTKTETGAQKTYTTTSALNVRSKPSTDPDTKLGRLPNGTVVEYVKTFNDKWTIIMFDGQKAYVASEYLKQSDDASPAQ